MAQDKWEKEKEALRKIQIHFSFHADQDAMIRHEAADISLTPSDFVRKIVGLENKKIQRPRIGLSFNASDLEHLAKRYNLSPDQGLEIKRRVQEEVNLHYEKRKNPGNA